MITITFTPETTAQANVVAQAMSRYLEVSIDSTPAPVAEQPAAQEAAPKKAKAAKPAATPAVTEAAPAEAAAPAPAAASPSEPAVTLEQVRAKLATLSQAGKAPAVKELLKKYGAAKLTDVAAETYAELLAAAEEL